jgi:hypothetical protein
MAVMVYIKVLVLVMENDVPGTAGLDPDIVIQRSPGGLHGLTRTTTSKLQTPKHMP